ncbi:MAG TPA: tetratricopeptide repeat protein [Vicinamibacteria bacterium]
MRRLLALILGAGIVLLPLPLPAQSADPELAQGVRQVREGDFEGAVATLESVVRRLSSAPERSRDLLQAYVNLGVAYVALDQRDLARSRFGEALARDRNLKLSAAEYSPKVLAVFEEARQQARPSGQGRKGSKTPYVIAGAAAAAAAGVVLATRGSNASAAFSGARFGNLVAVCPDDSINVPVQVLILVEAQAGSAALSIDSATAQLIIVMSADTGEVGFASTQATTVSPMVVAAKTHATLQVSTVLVCNNGPGDPGRFNEWSGRVTFTTSAGVFTVETADRLRVNIP